MGTVLLFLSPLFFSVSRYGGHMGTVLLFLSPLFFSVSRYGTFRFMTQAKAFAILKSASLK
jgi:hypothetical protein